jgi:UDP-N-acetylmuramyl pentapeptide synthase
MADKRVRNVEPKKLSAASVKNAFFAEVAALNVGVDGAAIQRRLHTHAIHLLGRTHRGSHRQMTLVCSVKAEPDALALPVKRCMSTD